MNIPTDSRSHFSFRLPSFRLGWLPWLAITLVLLLSGTSIAISDSTSATVPPVTLASAPLYAAGVRAKPTLTLALSVEFPTVGAQYTGTNDYAPGTAYLGYFNPDLCYIYTATTQQFDVTSAAVAHVCGGSSGNTSFSGNFLNWATSSAIDILRYGLTGGDRIVDTATATTLQRAVLSSSPSFYNSVNFPMKTISLATAAGAVPQSLLRTQTVSGSTSTSFTAITGPLYISNCLNFVSFGASPNSAGSCGAPGANGALGLQSSISTATSLPSGAVNCASENGNCTIPDGVGLVKVYFGGSTLFGARYNTRIVNSSIPCNTATFNTPASTNRSCYYAPYTPASGTTADISNTDNVNFYTRVGVCASMTGATADIRMVNGVARPFCTRYPNGTYKPTGDLQAYSDRVRVAAFGYLIDNNVNRYGGVLRAPMKYVGPTAYDSDFNLVSGGNSQSEWDANSGVFAANPLSETTVISPRTTATSGVVNYLNQFGRTGTPGTYKTDDPVNELYYEALRYVQGLSPTAQATSGMTDTMKDGFPVYNTLGTPTSSSHSALTTNLPTAPTFYDPQPPVNGLNNTVANSYSCLNNNILTIGDIHTHSDKSLPGYVTGPSAGDFDVTPVPASNMPDFSFWTKVAGGFESNTGVNYIDGNWVAQSTPSTTTAIGSNTVPETGLQNLDTMTFGDNNNYYLVGAAYWANTHDIRGLPYTGTNTNKQMAWADSTANQRPGMRVSTYFIDVNETNDSVPLSHRMAGNQFYLASKYGGFNPNNSIGGSPFLAADGTAATLWERGASGDPSNYFLASDAATVLNSIDQIFAAVTSDTASIAGTSTTSTTVTSTNGGSEAFRSTFSPTDWTGDVYPLLISTDASGNISLTESKTAPGWEAKTQFLHSDTTNWTNRNLVVGSDTTTDGTSAIAFKTFSTLTSSQQSQIVNSGTVAGQVLVDYLRGDHSNEAPASAGLRSRSTALGDIVNSGVVYEGAPSTAITDTSYLTAIGSTGKDFYDTYKTRTTAVYVGANDGMLHAFNATNGNELFGYIPSFVVPKLNALTSTSYVHQSYVDATPAVSEAQVGSNWATVLVSGAGGGGQGVFALDVTDPAAFDKTKVIWEFTDKNDSDMGNVIGTPGIFKFQTNAGSSATPTYNWYAVVASGVDNYASDGHVSSTGNPAIFILDLSKPAGTAWALGTNYFKISLPQASTAQAMGVANFSVYAPGGVVSRIYAGDLQGNLWALNFASTGAANWDFAHVNANTSGTPLFIAKYGSGSGTTLQPITDAPEITGYGGNLILLFGTGKYIESTDNSAPYLTQSAYAVLDPVSSTPSLTRTSLSPLTASSGAISGGSFAWGVPADSTNSVYAGWYLDVPNSSTSGERFISGFAIYSGTVFANSIIPAAGGCSGGTSNSYVFNLFGGNGSFVGSTVGLLGPPVLVFVGTPTTGTNPNTGQPNQTITVGLINSGSTGVSVGSKTTVTQEIGVRSWRQIFSYRAISGH